MKKNRHPEQLTKREKEILALIADGWTSRQIADKLSISIRTVETHREHIKQKTKIRSIAGLTKFAITQHDGKSNS